MKRKKITLSASIRALSGAPTPTAISLTPAESNLALDSFKVEANSQLRSRAYNPQLEELSLQTSVD